MSASAPPVNRPVDLTDPAGYRFWTGERVRFADLDRQGHVNNNAFGVYFEQGRVHLLEALRGFGPDAPWTVVLARSVVDHLAEVHYPAELRIGVRVLRIGNTSITLGLGVFDGATCAATQEAVSVLIDRGTGRPTPVPESLRAALAAH